MTLPSLTLNGFSQTDTSKQVEEVAIKFQLEPDEDAPMEGYFKVSDFQFIPTGSTTLCPTSSCEYELENGRTLFQFKTDNEKSLVGIFKVDTGESTKIMEMDTNLKAVEELETDDGETLQVVEGKLKIGKNALTPEFEYKINGTQTTDGENLILELTGTK